MGFLIVFLASFAAALGLTPLAGRLGERLGLVDRPRAGELQRRSVPRTGGYALFAAFFVGLLVSLPLFERFPDEYPRLIGLTLGALLILPLAVADDVRRLGPVPQLLGQMAIAAVPLAFGVAIDAFSTPLGGIVGVPGWLVVPLTLFWTVGMINTMNFVDTMDGLAAGVALIASAVLFAVSFQFGQLSIAALPLALAAALAAFLGFNFHPARIFMGTAGSMLLGYTLAELSIIGGAKIATAWMVLGLPILDVAWVILYRASRGRSPFKGGDSAHLPHRLLGLGLSQRQTALFLYALCLAFGLLAVVLTRWGKLYALLALGLVAFSLIALVGWASRTRGQPHYGLATKGSRGQDGQSELP